MLNTCTSATNLWYILSHFDMLSEFFRHVFPCFGHASMSLAGICIGEDYEDTRLHAVGDPAFAAIEHPVAAITHLGEPYPNPMSGSLLPVEIPSEFHVAMFSHT